MIADLPSLGEIKWCFGVVRGLKERRTIDEGTAKVFFRVLGTGGRLNSSDADRLACRTIIDICKRLLDQSPSERRGRTRSRRHRRDQNVSRLESTRRYDRYALDPDEEYY